MKKVVTLLLLAVFVLAQFSLASAAAVADADITLTNPSEFISAAAAAPYAETTFEWTLGALPAGTTYYVDIYARNVGTTTYATTTECYNVATVNGGVAASGTFDFAFASATANGETWEFVMTVDDAASCADGANVEAADVVMHSAYVDGVGMKGDYFNPPSLDTSNFSSTPVSCNTFEMWAIYSDKITVPAGIPYSGFGSWNTTTTGTFVPAPVGADYSLLSWVFTFPATASGPWVMSFDPTDAAGNAYGVSDFRDGTAPVDVVGAAELEDCADFSDTAGHADEVYIRYLADLGLIAGNPDGTFGPDNNLTRAEAATLFEISNGYDATTLPTSAPAGCDFTDVSASDWFAGWVWQACADGFMNGVGGGLFDPNNLLTRGQVVTIFNNIFEMGGGTGGHLDFAAVDTVLGEDWTDWENPYLRESAWADVSIGAYYAIPVLRAYGVGVADGTSATTFSPDQAATRGEFAKMLYRALSQQ